MYAGDVTPEASFAAVSAGAGVLVDVRTRAEWGYVGVPAVPAEFVEWLGYPDGAVNVSFVEQVAATGLEPGTPVYLLCRSGVRSRAAAEALTAAGYGPAYNIIDGFEGQLDERGHRGRGGWKSAGLPWKQG